MKRLRDLIGESGEEIRFPMKKKSPFSIQGKKRVNVLALGDVGGMLLTGLRLLGGDIISRIGIYDVSEPMLKRYEAEMNQIAYPWSYGGMPEVCCLDRNELFDCDVFVFCASKGVPSVGSDVTDVRMIQFEANRAIIEGYGKEACDREFKGLFAVVSDPVDPLCKAVLLQGLSAEQVQGYGLGVMNGRAAYFAKKDERFQRFLTEGRAFGPHGQDLVIADSIDHYDKECSEELTKLTVEANLRIREMGFKPFIAPALASGAISILLTLRGEWHYSSTLLGEVFLGAKNRMTERGVELEELELPDPLFYRIKRAYDHLKKMI